MNVVCALLIRGNKFFLTQRSDSRLWELPGGKVEPDESLQQALSRELREELNLNVNEKDFLQIGLARTNKISLHVFASQFYANTTWTPREHCATTWTTVQQVLRFPACEADTLFFATNKTKVEKLLLEGSGFSNGSKVKPIS